MNANGEERRKTDGLSRSRSIRVHSCSFVAEILPPDGLIPFPDRPQFGFRAGGLQIFLDLLYDFRMFDRDVVLFAEVVFEIIQFERRIRAFANGLPIAHSNGLRET